MDVRCLVCAEPWDGPDFDMTKAEIDRFRRGKGCPSCGFGHHCPICFGTGVRNDCRRCSGNGLIEVWSPHKTVGRFKFDRWYEGYSPSIAEHVRLEIVKRGKSHKTADGYVQNAWAKCPTCLSVGPHCTVCDGTGKPRPLGEVEKWSAIESHIEGSDEDPIYILNSLLDDRD